MTDSADLHPPSASEREPRSHEHNRRDFLRLGAAAGLGALGALSLAGCASVGRRLTPAPAKPFAAPPMPRVRIGFVGVGGMGSTT
jgi:hypothetical protein